MLYDGNVIAKETNVISIADSEESLMLEDESRSKMLLKQSVPMVLEKKISNPSTDSSDASPVKWMFLVNYLSESVKKDIDEIKTINIELEHRVSKLIAENEHLKQTYKQLYDSIKPTRVRAKEHTLKNDLRKLKGKGVVDCAAQIPIATTIVPGMFKLDLDPLALDIAKIDAHIDTLSTQEQADILRERRTFTLVGNSCPLTRITSTKVVPHTETTPHSAETPKPELKIYSWGPKEVKNVGLSKKAKIVESKVASNSEPNHSWGSNATDVPSSFSLINDRLSRLFSDLEAAFRKHTCFVRNLEGVDLLLGSQETNLYTLSIGDMIESSPICSYPKPQRPNRASVVSLVLEVPALVESTGLPSSTSIDQDAPSPKTVSEESSSSDVIPTTMHSDIPISEHPKKWTKDHLLQNIIGELSRPVSTRLQLHEQALFCYYDAFLTSVEPKTYKDALTQSCWIGGNARRANEFERLEV
ncbi:hypothetical protein Tco_0862125 [Tanacetum coccineum]